MRTVTPDTLRFTGVASAELGRSPRIADVKDELARHIGSRPIVRHSIEHALALLRSAGLTLPNRTIDTYRLATAILPDMPNYQLGTLSSILGFDIAAVDRHRA